MSLCLDLILYIIYICIRICYYVSVCRYNVKTGEWAHLSRFSKFPTRVWLSNIYNANGISANPDLIIKTPDLNEIIESVLGEVKKLDSELKKKSSKLFKIHAGNVDGESLMHAADQVDGGASGKTLFEKLRWFVMHGDVSHSTSAVQGINPINPMEWISCYDNAQRQVPKLHAFEAPEDVLNLTTTYAHIRSKKLSAHHCSSTENEISAINKTNRTPRYVENGLKISTPRTMSGSNDTDNTVRIISNKEENIDSNAAKLDQTDELICTDGSCFLMRNSVPKSTVIVAGSESDEVSSQLKTESEPVVPKRITAIAPPKKIMKLVGQAIKDWNMIEDGDRILLGLSGGKDSLTMLHTLIAFQVSCIPLFVVQYIVYMH